MKKVKAIVLTGYGLNCDSETDYALKIAGAESYKIHINEVINNKHILDDFHILVFIGGFSWADDHGAGVILASKIKNHLFNELQEFINNRKLIIGICNGFQVLVNLGLLPADEGDYWKKKVALVSNDSGNFIDKWVKLKVNKNSPCVFTKDISFMELPIRHAEGKFYATMNVINTLIKNNQVVFQYLDNPNGSLMDIAGICDPSGRIMGLMPHPEAFNHLSNYPDWVRNKSLYPEKGDGIKIFENAIKYTKENLL